jgi:hypothetical protein
MDAHDKRPITEWPNAPRIVNEVGAHLQEQYGEEGIPTDEFKRGIERTGGFAKDSVLPSDYCYNSINKAPISFQYRLLIRLGQGRYEHVGLNHSYTGSIMWKPKHGAEQQVGCWIDGECHLDFDPRKAFQGNTT